MRLASLTLLAADGLTPIDLELDLLPPAERVLELITEAFGPFLAPGAPVRLFRGSLPATEGAGLHLVYVYGHAWLRDQALFMSFADRPEAVSGEGLAALLATAFQLATTAIVVDTCHAEALAPALSRVNPQPRFVGFGSAADESGISLVREKASRLALSLHDVAQRAATTLDLAATFAEISRSLDRDGVIQGQTVSYRMSGAQIVLERGAASEKRRREVTARRIRQRLIVGGIAMTLMIGWAEELYRTSTWVQLDLTPLSGGNAKVQVTILLEEPNENRSKIWSSNTYPAEQVRLRMPAADVIVRVAATAGGPEFAMSFPMLLAPTLRPADKLRSLTLPDALAIGAHAGMTYIAPTTWIQGQNLATARLDNGFWLDRHPPTVERFIAIAEALEREGSINVNESVLLMTRQRQAALKNTGLEQLNTLNNQLGEVFGKIAKASSMHVEAPGDVAEGLGTPPCNDCPAPMTRFEAQKYCEARSARLPTNLEWELAARGVDGRLYPWGNRFDASKVNAGLPAEVGIPKTLEPITRYADAMSPYGLIDMVGNAGDWVVNDSGAYERIYMGATYRYNPEDATTFRLLPVTDSYNLQEITVRCASD